MRNILQNAQAPSWLAHSSYTQHNFLTFSTSNLEASAAVCRSINNPLCQGVDNDVIVPPLLSELVQSLNEIFSVKLNSHFFCLFVWVTAGNKLFCPVCASGWYYLTQNPLWSVNHSGHPWVINQTSITDSPSGFPDNAAEGVLWSEMRGQMWRGHHAPSKAATLMPLRSPKSSPSPSQYSPSSSWSSKRGT